MITTEQRDSTFETASEVQKSLYDSYSAGVAIGEIAQRHTVMNRVEFAIAIGDVILGLVPQEKLPDLLIERLQITRPEAMKVTADVLDFLAPLSQPAATIITDNEMLEVEIAEAEASLKSAVQPMRTMSHDMETARHPATPTHQATSQTDLLNNT